MLRRLLDVAAHIQTMNDWSFHVPSDQVRLPEIFLG
jgi:hypothetical protein